jgi:hypothetical protein
MKTLKNHTILYDAECPMCNLYTSAFVRCGMLDSNGREPYQQTEIAGKNLNMQRAVNEIALLDNSTGEVQYGVRSLLKILGNAFPVIKTIFKFRPFVWLAEKLYAFVSYNRRVIIPIDTGRPDFAYQPSFRVRYRLLYLIFTAFVTGAVLTAYDPLVSDFVPDGNVYRGYVAAFGQVLFQGVIAGVLIKDKCWDYLGNMMTISFAGVLLLTPVIFIAKFVAIPDFVALSCVGVVVSLMFLEHTRRSRLLHIGWKMKVTWVLYRVLVLSIIFL